MSDNTIHKHLPLTEASSTRLIKLLPGDQYDEIRCKLFTVNLLDNPEYDAISYVWGDEHDKASIICNGQLLSIPRNLVYGLKRFRQPSTCRVLWADSICIDQNSVVEKNHQVRMMGQIYSSASCVLIWLGLDDGTLGLDYDILCQLAKLNEHRSELKALLLTDIDWRIRGEPFRNHSTITAKFNIPKQGSPGLAALEELCKNSWFYRAWTFQESVLAKERRFFIGLQEISTDVLYSAIDGASLLTVITDITYLSNRDARKVREILQLASDYGFPRLHERWTLRRLLYTRSGIDCKLGTDLVYSLLGVTIDTVDIVPDYNLSFDRVFCRAVEQIISVEKDLDILIDAQRRERSTVSELPSWVPDWRDELDGSMLNTKTQQSHIRSFDFSRTSKPIWSVTHNDGRLRVRGATVAKVKGLEPAPVHPELILNLMYNCAHGSDDDCTSGHGMSDKQLLRILLSSGLPGLNHAQVTAESNSPGNWIEKRLFELVKGARNATLHEYMYFIYSFLCANKHQLLMWACGFPCPRFGLVPDHTKASDLIVMLLGCSMPVILRPTENSNEYLFIGVGYLDEMMDGQAYDLVMEHEKQAHASAPGVARFERSSEDVDKELPFQLRDFILV